MLSEEETQAFLALLLGFATSTGASGRMMAKLFNVSTITMARWLRAARGQEGQVERMYYCRTDAIKNTILAANEHAEKNGLYRRIAAVSDPVTKTNSLQALIASSK
jgi:transposase